MRDINWFRNKTWDEEIEKHFFSKLQRVRSDGMKAQYLQLQAGILAYTKDAKLMKMGEKLINKLFTDYPDNKGNKSIALNTMGNIHKFRGNNQGALDYYKQSIDFEAIFPNSITNSFIDYSELAVKTKQTNLYNDVEKIFSEERYSNFTMFPHTNYKKYSILSIISKYKGETEKAKHYADLAEQNVAAAESGFSKHQTLGLVRERDELLDKLMYE